MSERSHSANPSNANRRRLLLSAAAAVILVAGAGGAVGYRYLAIERDYAARKAHAITDVDRGTNLEAAIADLKAVIQHRPADVEAISALARAMLRRSTSERQNVIDAARYYNTLLELEPGRVDERAEMVRLLDLLGESEAVLKFISPLIELRPQEATLHRLRTMHLMRMSRLKEAEVAAKSWSDVAPDDFQAQWAYISLLSQNGKDQGQPGSVLNQKQAAGANRDLWTLVRAVWQLGSKQSEAASVLLDELLAKPSLASSLNRPLVLALDEAGRRRDADRILARAIESRADESLIVLSALRDMDRANYTRALETLEAAPRPNDPALKSAQLCVTAFIARRTGKSATFEAIMAELNGVPVEYGAPWRAVLAATDNTPPTALSARELLMALRSSVLVEDGVALLQLATADCLASLNQVRAADRLLAEASRASAGWSACARQLFELRRAQGQVVQAVEAAQFAFNKSGRTIDSAILLARAVSDSKPTGVQADNLLQLLREIQRAVPGEVQTIGLYVDALAARGDASASSVLREALERNESIPLEYLLQWSELSQHRRLGLEAECLAKAEADFGLTPRLALARALTKKRAGQPDEALSELRAARAAHSDQSRGFDEAIASFLLYARSPDAAEAWNALAAANPNDVDLQVRLLDLGFATTPEQVQAVVSRIRKNDPGNLRAELADIRLGVLSSSGRASIDAAVLRLNRLLERAPDLIGARLLLVDLLAQSGQSQSAVAQWEKATQLVPDDPNLILAGAQLLVANGERTRATEVLQRLGRLDPNLTPSQRMAEAKAYLALGVADRTLDILEPMNDLPRDARLTLAEAYFRAGKADAGRALLDELLKVPDLDTLLFAAAVEDSEGRREQSGALLERAKDLAQLSEADRLRVAQFASERGGLDRVVSILSNISVSNDTTIRIAQLWVEHGDVDSAIKVLSDAAAKTSDASSLRRRLRDEPQIRGLVALKLNSIGSQLLETPDDLGTRQMVEFALQTQKQTVREQQLSLDRLSALEESSYALQMFLADRFLAMNQPMAAETHARLAAALRPSSPQPMALAAMAAARAGNTGRCAQAIKDWRDRLPRDSTLPDALDARNLARRREHTELLARYEPRVAAAGGRAALDVLFAVAQAMHARGRDDDAIRFVKPVIESDSRASALWFNLIANEVDATSAWKSIQAFRQLVEQRQLPNERVALAICADRAARRAHNPDWIETASALLKPVEAQANELPVESVIRLADNRATRGDLNGAQDLYRRAIAPRQETAVLETRLAEILRRQAKLDDALAMIDRALTSPSATALMHDTRAGILQDIKRLDDALVSAQTAQRMDELNPRWLLRVASIQLAKRDIVTARPTLEMLRWFFREPEAWDKDLIDRFHAFEAGVTRRPTSGPST